MPRGSITLTDWSQAVGLSSAKRRFEVGDILFGRLRPYFQKVGVAPIHGVCSTETLVLRPYEDFDRALVATVASSDELISYVSAAATGTRMPRASWNDVKEWPVPALSRDQRVQLGEQTGPMLSSLAQKTAESHRLSALRDALLPELLSGRIKVSEARETIEETIDEEVPHA